MMHRSGCDVAHADYVTCPPKTWGISPLRSVISELARYNQFKAFARKVRRAVGSERGI